MHQSHWPKRQKVMSGNVTFLPVSRFDLFKNFSFSESTAQNFVSNFSLKPQTKGESGMWTPATFPLSHLRLDPNRLRTCSERLRARMRGCHDRPQLLLMTLLGCSTARLLSRCVRRRGSDGAPLLIIRQIPFWLIDDFKSGPAKLLKVPKLQPSIGASGGVAANVRCSEQKVSQRLSSVSDTDAKLL